MQDREGNGKRAETGAFRKDLGGGKGQGRRKAHRQFVSGQVYAYMHAGPCICPGEGRGGTQHPSFVS